MAAIHPRLLQDCLVLGRFPLCHVLLMRDANYPWFILVPDREAIQEIHRLEETDQQQLMRESVCLSGVIETLFRPDKLNIAALGNVVPQLHVHHIARYRTDVAWPAPVWGKLPAADYDALQLQQRVRAVCSALQETGDFQHA